MAVLAGPLPYALGASFGAVLHLLLFRFGEWDLAGPGLIFYFTSLNALVTGVLLFLGEAGSLQQAFLLATALVSSIVAGIFTSMVVYRVFFHRLRRFPGPFMAQFTNFYATYLSVKRAHLYEEIQALHAKYGDIVRVGPTELSINDPKALHIIHSTQSTCRKGPFYTVMHPMTSLQHVTDKKEHSIRRKAWDRGFSIKALQGYESRVFKYTDQLLEKVRQSQGTPLDVALWFNFYSFDVMGDLAFGKSFNMLVDGVKHFFMTSLHNNMFFITLIGHMMWLFPVIKITPGVNFEYLRFRKWIENQIHERMANEPERPDIFSWVLEDYRTKEAPTKQDFLNLVGDGYLIVIAGSDTSAAVLTCLFYHLSLNPKVLQTLRAELDGAISGDKEFDTGVLGKLKYLQAVIDETMRLHPPVPSGLQRVTHPDGMRIGEHFIPGDTIVQIPSYTMYRDKRLFSQPDEFIPERWTTRPELTKDASLVVPFSIGRYSCVGKQLALMEIRQVTARIVREYDFQPAPGQDPKAFLNGILDTFTLTLPPLKMVFTPRKDGPK